MKPSPADSQAVALVLAGGSGTRFWPLSRRRRPKQLLALDGPRTLLQATVDRLQPLIAPESVWVATTRDLDRMHALLSSSKGDCPVMLHLSMPKGREAILALKATRVDVGDAIFSGLERIFGERVAELR